MLATFDNSFARLPGLFFSHTPLSPVRAPTLIAFNDKLANELFVETHDDNASSLADLFSGNILAPGMEPIAMAYAGHQFGNFVPQLGDGRALLLGEVIDRNGFRRDIQLKGSGRTAFSRGGDGRAALGPVVREYLISEAMHALGIKTTRSLAAVATGEPVYRETALPGAILTRVAQSHIRIGTFEFAAAHGTLDELRILADHAIARLYPSLAAFDHRYAHFLAAVMDAQAALVARWMQIGFIHGVMNTDNMAISGETIDYGPCAFIDAYDPATVFSSIDIHGRYAFGNQPSIAQWNLTRFAETLLPLLHSDIEQAITIAETQVNDFPDMYYHYWLEGMYRKIGLTHPHAGDVTLLKDLLTLMQEQKADYTLTFRSLSLMLENKPDALPPLAFFHNEAVQKWLQQWRKRLESENASLSAIAEQMRTVNPVYIPRNGHIEAAIHAAVEEFDFSKMKTLQTLLATPYEKQPGAEAYAFPGKISDTYKTFCGT